jgi:hypothetical protein
MSSRRPGRNANLAAFARHLPLMGTVKSEVGRLDARLANFTLETSHFKLPCKHRSVRIATQFRPHPDGNARRLAPTALAWNHKRLCRKWIRAPGYLLTGVDPRAYTALGNCVRGGIGILPMVHGLEGALNAESCVGEPKPMLRRTGFSHSLSDASVAQ